MRTTYEKLNLGQQFIRESCGQRFIACRDGAVVLEGTFAGDVYIIRADETVVTDTDIVLHAIAELTRRYNTERDTLKDEVLSRISELLQIFNTRNIEGGPAWLRSLDGEQFLTQLRSNKANKIWWQCSRMDEEICQTYPEVVDILKLVQTCEDIDIHIGHVKAIST